MSSDWRPAPPLDPGPDPAPARRGGAGAAALLILGGMALMLAVAALEARWLRGEPLGSALILVDPPASAPADAPAARIRRVPAEAYAPNALVDALRTAPMGDDGMDWDAVLAQTEPVIALPLPLEEFAPLLASGRLPAPGAPEVLAGHHSLLEAFELDGTAFAVVGRLRPGVAIGHFAYLLPEHPALAAHFHETGALLVDGRAALSAIIDAEEEGDTAFDPAAADLIGLRFPTLPGYAWATWLGLILMALGGLRATLLYFARGAAGRGPFGPLYREALARPGLFFGVHAFLYGVLFMAMVQGLGQPAALHQLGRVVEAMFQQGGLSYIGDAYASGNILWAAVTTWWNNYAVQTLGLTFFTPVAMWWMGMLPTPVLIPVLWPLPLGVLKTAASFGLVGFAMAPANAHTASGYWFHGVTMILELEAYIIACFVVVAWPLVLAGALLRGEGMRGLRNAAALLGAGIGFTAVLLAVAGLYEAATLILLR